MQFSSVLDTGGTAANDYHVHQPVDLLIRLILECSGLHTCGRYFSSGHELHFSGTHSPIAWSESCPHR